MIRVVLALLSLAAIAGFLFVALSRIGYPYELEFMTGACLDHVDRILDGEPIYVAPSASFVTWLYGPLYFYAGAGASLLAGGSSLVVLRVVSLGSALVTTALVALIVGRKTRSPLAALVAVGLWTSTYGIVGTWWDIGRVDSMFVAWTAASLAALLLGRGARSAAAAGVLLTLAFMTKQTALVLAPPFAVAVAFTSLPRAAWFAGAFAATLVPSFLLIDTATDGWFSFYAWDTPRAHGYEFGIWWAWFPGDTVAILPMVLASAWYVGRLLGTSRPRAALCTGAWCSGLWLATNLSRAHLGGAENVLIPTHLGFAIVAALALAEAAGDRAWRTPIALLVALQFPLSAYDPWHYLPTAADRAIGDRLVSVLESSERPVMLPQHGHYARRTGHPAHAHVLAVMDIMRGPDPALGERVLEEFLTYTWDADCDIAVLDVPSNSRDYLPLFVRDPSTIEWDYEPLFEEELDENGDPVPQANGRALFMPVVGIQARPKEIWRRKR